jgi:hypothetical protein
VAVGIIAIIFAIFIPYFVRAREMSERTRCVDHLHQIGMALSQYAKDNGSQFHLPEVVYSATTRPMGYSAFTGPDDGNPFAGHSAVEPNDVTASLWLLVRDGYIKDLSVFICPSTADEADHLTDAFGHPVSADQRGNFRSPKNLSYSYASPFTNAYQFLFTFDDLPAKFAILADKNPGFATSDTTVTGPAHDAPPFELAQANSFNHQRAGQFVLFAAGDVSFESSPYCGVSNDNIFTALAPQPLQGSHPALDGPGYFGTTIGPAYKYDSYLVPSAMDSGK